MARPALRRVADWAAVGVGIAVTVMCVTLFVAMRVDDATIDAHLGTATATVLTVSPLRTGIEFVDAAGTAVRPASGVLYPGLLDVGQQFVVEYATTDPTVVRVAGRTAAVGNLVLAAAAVGTWMVLGALWWTGRWAGRIASRRRAGSRARAAERTRPAQQQRRAEWHAGRPPTGTAQPDTSASTSSATAGTATIIPSSGSG